jgi:hypothetical protein
VRKIDNRKIEAKPAPSGHAVAEVFRSDYIRLFIRADLAHRYHQYRIFSAIAA